MFGTQDTDTLVKRTLKELEDDSTSTTYDEVMMNFIDYITRTIMAAQDVPIQYAIDHMDSDEFQDELHMYIENYFGRFCKPKHLLDDLVWAPKEQLDEI